MAYELFLDSFDTDISASRWALFQGVNPTITIPSSGTGRHGSASARISGTFPYAYGGFRSQYFAPSNHIVVGAAVRKNSTTNLGLIGLLSGSTGGADMRVGDNGLLQYYPGSGSVAIDTSYNIDAGVWYYLELGVVIGVGGSVEVRVNGQTIVSVTGIDTRIGGLSTCNAIQLYFSGGNPIGSVDFEDLYVAIGNELKWLGDIRVDALALDGNASPQDWIPDSGNAWERLNQTSGNVSSNTINAESMFSVANLSFDTPAIHGVQIGIIANKTETDQKNIVIEANNNNITVNSNIIALGTSSTEYTYSLAKDTDGVNWSKQRFNDLKVGIKVV